MNGPHDGDLSSVSIIREHHLYNINDLAWSGFKLVSIVFDAAFT